MSQKQSKSGRKGKSGRKAAAESMTNDAKLALRGFSTAGAPDVSCIKFVYSDYRSMTSSVSEGEYVFRLNSLFDPDFTGVGGQPDYYDQWKTLYTRYRVVACQVEVEAVGFSGIGFLAIAPTVASTSLTNAIEAGGLRHAKSGIFTLGQGSSLKLNALYRMSELSGVSDEAVLNDNEFAALVGTSPAQTYFLHVCARTNGASDVTNFAIKLTYYARMEAADYKLDSFARHRARAFFASGLGMPLSETRDVVAQRDQAKVSAAQSANDVACSTNPVRDNTLSKVSYALADVSAQLQKISCPESRK